MWLIFSIVALQIDCLALPKLLTTEQKAKSLVIYSWDTADNAEKKTGSCANKL